MTSPIPGRRRLLVGAAGLAGLAATGGLTGCGALESAGRSPDPAPSVKVSGRRVRWSRTFPRTYDDDPYPRVVTVADDTVYAGQNGTLHALSATTGKLRWTSRYGPIDSVAMDGLRDCAPVVADGVVYVMRNREDKPGVLSALDARTGKLRWTFDDTGTGISPPAVSGDTVCFTTLTSVITLDAGTGRKRWAVGDSRGTPLTYGSPAVAGDIVCVADLSNVIVGLDAKTGKKRWIQSDTADFAAGGQGHALSAVGDVVYLSGYCALDLATGKVRWTSTADVPDGMTPVTVADGALYVSDGHQSSDAALLTSLDAGTGHARWTFTVHGRNATTEGPPAVSGDTVCVGSRASGVFGVDAKTGRQRWHLDTDGNRTGGPVISGDTVYVFVRSPDDVDWFDQLYAFPV
ncbi:MAG: PQQ-binding-like beta-propeller repeat protein [Actinocatenispora sp.]